MFNSILKISIVKHFYIDIFELIIRIIKFLFCEIKEYYKADIRK